MNRCILPTLLLLLSGSEAFTTSSSKSYHRRTALTSTYAAEILWYPPVAADVFPVPSSSSDPAQDLNLFDTVASMAASWILDMTNAIPQEQIAQSTTVAAAGIIPQQADNKLHHLSRESLRDMMLQDVHQRNSLVTADFTQTIYEDSCRFQDGSGLDGAYPMKPWILGCKLLFKGDKSQTTILEESLIISSRQISFRFESDLEFRGPFRPQVALSGRVVMTRNPLTGLISSYREIWDKDVFEIVKEARLQL